MTIGLLDLTQAQSTVALERLIAANRRQIDALIRATGNNVYQQFVTSPNISTRIWPSVYAQIVGLGQRNAAAQAAAFYAEYSSITAGAAVAIAPPVAETFVVTNQAISAQAMPRRYGRLLNEGATRAAALDTAGRYGSELAAGDLQWAQRAAGEEFTAQAHRHARTEKSLRGWHKIPSGAPCGWCITVADQLYSSADSIPMHNGCRCGVAPATEGDGFEPNQLSTEEQSELLADPAAPAAASIAPVEHGGVVAAEDLPVPF